jgi:ubiquinol-cytochrome c reductase cytochrome c1 subunit
MNKEVFASAEGLHPPTYPWVHQKKLGAFDHASLRRGFQVYREICAACHSLEKIAFRHLINVTHTEDELKEIAAEYQIVDGPNDQGEMFTRPGRVRKERVRMI